MSDYNDGILLRPCLRMDTHFGDEYESVEFGDGTGYIKAAPILAKVGALHEEIDRLRDESAELRELVRESVRFERYGCYGCSREDTCGAQGIYDEECVRRQGIEQSMRELGIEVE